MHTPKRIIRNKTPKSILKQTKNAEDVGMNSKQMELQQEAKYWKSRFENLAAKREKQQKNTLRDSIWDKEQKNLAFFTKLESQISDNQKESNYINIEDGRQNKSIRGRSKENRVENDEEYYQLEEREYVREDFELRGNEENQQEFQQQRGATYFPDDEQNKNELISELRLEVATLMGELSEWKASYNEAVDPIHFQNMEKQLLQEFLNKMQQGIQEAAAHFEDEKRTYLQIKNEELEQMQTEILELSGLIAEKDKKIQQKNLKINELEEKEREKDLKIESTLKEARIIEEQFKRKIEDRDKLLLERDKLLLERDVQLKKEQVEKNEVILKVNSMQIELEKRKNEQNELNEEMKRNKESYDKMQKENQSLKFEIQKVTSSCSQEVEVLNKQHCKELEKVREDCKRDIDRTKDETKKELEKIKMLGRDALAQWEREKNELQNKVAAYRDRLEDSKEKIIKLKNEKESQEELSEQMEEHRNKEQQLQQELTQLQSEHSSLQEKYSVYDQLIHQKGFEVQQLVKALQEEMQNYAAEIELAQQQESKYQAQIQELEQLLEKEKKLSGILQDTILVQKAQYQNKKAE